MRKLARWCSALVPLCLVLTCAAPAAADVTPQEACAAALSGNPVLDGIARLGTPLICEARPANAPPVAGGEYGYGVIHLWPVGLDPRLVVRLSAHELGHAYSANRPDLTAAWYSLRGSSGQSGQEDFAEDFYLANYREPGLSWVTYGGLPVVTEDQLAVMRGWWNGSSPVQPTTVAPQRPATTEPPMVEDPVPSPPPVTHAVAPQRPAAVAVPAPAAADPPAAPPVGARGVASVLAALRLAGA